MSHYEGPLILLFSITFAIVLFRSVRRGDDVFVILLGFLFVYTIFTQIGYAYYPDVAIRARTYFGPDIFLSYWSFVYFSFLATAAIRAVVFHPAGSRAKPYEDSSARIATLSPIPFLMLAVSYLLVLGTTFSLNYGDIRYANIGSVWIAYLIHFQPVFVLVLYMRSRTVPGGAKRRITWIITSVAVLLFIIISFRTGQRLAALSLLVGICFFELSPFYTLSGKRGRIIGVAVGAALFLFLADRVVEQRNEYAGETPIDVMQNIFARSNLTAAIDPEMVIQQDYFAPSTLIFVSIYHDLIIPEEVLRSNAANALVFMGYPYLSNTFAAIVNPVGYSRSESYGYYIFTEGFNFAGWWGILYNAIIMNLGLKLWEVFATSRNAEFNKCIRTLLALLTVALVRAQSVTFVRSAYLEIIPGMILVALAFGYWPRWSSPPAPSRYRSSIVHA